MWKVLIKLVEKWACMHDDKLIHTVTHTCQIPYEKYNVHFYKCVKCGRVAKLVLKP
jgi:hypothetical protein